MDDLVYVWVTEAESSKPKLPRRVTTEHMYDKLGPLFLRGPSERPEEATFVVQANSKSREIVQVVKLSEIGEPTPASTSGHKRDLWLA